LYILSHLPGENISHHRTDLLEWEPGHDRRNKQKSSQSAHRANPPSGKSVTCFHAMDAESSIMRFESVERRVTRCHSGRESAQRRAVFPCRRPFSI
jgi:hypothetical protein